MASTIVIAFIRLRDEGVLTAATAMQLGRAVGLRNVVAHGYAGVDPALVHTAATTGLSDLERFAQEIVAWLSMHGRGP